MTRLSRRDVRRPVAPSPSPPTPIRISRRTRTALVVAAAALLVLVLWRAPSVLTLSLTIQGALSSTALYFLGVPYAVLLGVWVAVTALIPFLGAWIGAIPAVLLALSVSPTTALLTAARFLAIQQLEGNVLTPRIQGHAHSRGRHDHPDLVSGPGGPGAPGRPAAAQWIKRERDEQREGPRRISEHEDESGISRRARPLILHGISSLHRRAAGGVRS